MSQRLFSFLFIAALWAVIAAAALTSGAAVSFGGTFEQVILKVLIPLFATFLLLKNWFLFLDGKVAEGTLDPGDNVALFMLRPFYLLVAGAGAAAFELFGLQFLSEDAQTILIDGFVLVAQTLLESFSNRLPLQKLTVAQKQAAAASAPPHRD